jgi:hypothetical protein
MSIEAMKQALEALEICAVRPEHQWNGIQLVSIAKASLHQAIAEAEKQEPKKPLTDEQIMDALKLKACDGYRAIVRAIEAAHGIGKGEA